MRKKLGLPSSIAVLIVILTLIFPHVSSAGVREYIVSNTTVDRRVADHPLDPLGQAGFAGEHRWGLGGLEGSRVPASGWSDNGKQCPGLSMSPAGSPIGRFARRSCDVRVILL